MVYGKHSTFIFHIFIEMRNLDPIPRHDKHNKTFILAQSTIYGFNLSGELFLYPESLYVSDSNYATFWWSPGGRAGARGQLADLIKGTILQYILFPKRGHHGALDL